MDYLHYVHAEGHWYPPLDANMSEIVYMIVAAGRNNVRFRLGDQMPFAYSIYARHEKDFQRRTGRRGHIYHRLTDDEYHCVVRELEHVLSRDPCNREWLRRSQP